MKKKIIALAVAAALLAIAVIGGTFAYFTAEEDATNTFTVGNVKIDLLESQYHRAGAYGDGTVKTDAQIEADDQTYQQDYLAKQELMPGVQIMKCPYVKNTGASDAYVRIRVLIPTALNLSALNSSVICTSALENEFHRPAGVGYYDVEGTTTIDGVEYDIYSFIRNEALEPEEMTYWNVWNLIKMDEDVTSEELEAYIAAGAIVNNQFNVIVQADAIQAATFADADAAFAEFDK